MSSIKVIKAKAISCLPNGVRALAKYPLSKFNSWRFKAYQRLLESLADILVTDPIIRVPEFEGSFRIDARSDLFRRIVIYKEYEPLLARIAAKYAVPDRDFIDVGANVGFYSVLLAQHLTSGRGYAIEPTTKAFERLQGNIILNNLQDRITLIKGAIADHSGSLVINVIPGKEEYSSLGGMHHPSISSMPFYTETVPAFTLDEIVKEHDINPAFIKIDVEGCEHLVIAGARETLLKKRPVILTELWDPLITRNGSSSREVINTLRDLGYRVEHPISGVELKDTKSTVEILCLPL